MLKSLLVWLLLLALPFQGYAAASMLPCAPAHAAASSSAMLKGAHHDHSKTLAAQQAGSHHGAEKAPAKHHGNGQCKACSACCPANLMVTAFQLASDTPHFATIPFKTGFMPVVALALPERPPQGLI